MRLHVTILRVWVSILLVGMLLAVSLLLFAFFYSDGLGVVKRDGEYLLMQGSAVRTIDQRLGFTMYVVARAFVLAGIIIIALGASIRMTAGALNPFTLLARHDPGNRILAAGLSAIALLCCSISIALLIGAVLRRAF